MSGDVMVCVSSVLPGYMSIVTARVPAGSCLDDAADIGLLVANGVTISMVVDIGAGDEVENVRWTVVTSPELRALCHATQVESRDVFLDETYGPKRRAA